MRDEIQAGLKNAIERGFSLESAIQSFISAGYNPVEVKEAAESLGSSVASIIQQNKNPVLNSAVQNINYEHGSPSSNIFSTSFFQQGQQANPGKDRPTQAAQANQPNQPNQDNLIPRTNQIQQYPNYSQQKKKSKTGLIITLAVILVILLAGLMGLIFFSGTILNIFFGK